MMKKFWNRFLATACVTALAVGMIAPATPVLAASKNKVVEIPVNFTNSSWEDDWDSTSLSDICFWSTGEPSAYSESYTVSYKLYIPASFMKGEADINVGGGISFDDASAEEWQWAGYADLPSYDFHVDGTFTTWDEEKEQDVPITYATAKKTGDFYVVSYEAKAKAVNTTDAPADVTKAEKVAVTPNIGVKGINITAKNSAIYLDDLKITKADGTVIRDQNFTSDKKVEGETRVAPKKGDNDGKAIKLATITDNKVLTVKSTKVNVKVKKTAKISATATPATKVTYTSSNKKVATVNSKGVVTGKKAGKAVISVKANGKTVKVSVTVKK